MTSKAAKDQRLKESRLKRAKALAGIDPGDDVGPAADDRNLLSSRRSLHDVLKVEMLLFIVRDEALKVPNA